MLVKDQNLFLGQVLVVQLLGVLDLRPVAELGQMVRHLLGEVGQEVCLGPQTTRQGRLS